MEGTENFWKRQEVKYWQSRGFTRKQAIIFVEIHGFYMP